MSVYKNYSCDTQEEREKRFDNFLNKTIVMSSKRYFKKENNIGTKEKTIVDNADFCAFLQGFIDVENSCFDDVENKLQLNSALNTLSVVEQAVIFLLFQEELSQDEAAKILEICSKSVSRIKIRALNKMKKYLEGDV